MEPVMTAAGAVLALGSLSGLTAAVRVGSLERRLDALERGAKRAHTTANTIPATTIPAPTEIHDHARSTPARERRDTRPEEHDVSPPSDDEALQDRWKDLELRAGTRWTSWVGAAAFVIAAALLIKLAVERGWLGPTARLLLGIACAAGFLAAGWRAHHARMRVLSHGLLGAGLGVLYISLYVASVTHALLPAELAFGAMVAVTVAGCVLALALDAQALATLAWLGGLLTPLLVPSVIASRDLACTYVLVLAIVGSTCAAVRQWQSLALAAFAGSALVLGRFLVERHDAATWQVELAWLAAFHLAMHVPIAIGAWRRALAPLWSWFALANAVAALGGMATIVGAHEDIAGAATLALAIVHAALAMLVRRRVAVGTPRLLLPALATVMAATAIALLVPPGVVTLAWAVSAVALVAVLRARDDTSLRKLALALLAFAAWHGAARAHGTHDPLSIAIIPIAAWSFAAIHHRRHASERAVTLVAALGGLAFLLLAVSSEIERHVGPSTARALVPAVWAAGSLALSMFWHHTRAGQHAAAAAVLIAGHLIYVAYRGGAGETTVVFNVRFAAALAVLGAVAAIAMRAGRWSHVAKIAMLAGVIALVGAEMHVSYAGRAADAALSIGWGVLAGLLLAIGFTRRQQALRSTGLGLLGIVALKLVVLDLAGAPPLLRVISFVVLGTVMIAASYGYHRLE